MEVIFKNKLKAPLTAVAGIGEDEIVTYSIKICYQVDLRNGWGHHHEDGLWKVPCISVNRGGNWLI
jgi:hypothetical protein